MIRDDLRILPPVYKGALQLIPGGGVEFTLSPQAQQPCFVEYGMHHTAREFYASVPFCFPRGYTFSENVHPEGREHKLLCVFTANGIGRMLVKLRGGGSSPRLTIFFEHLNLTADLQSDVDWPADGTYHLLELLVERTGSPQDRVQMWLDGRQCMDLRSRTCGAEPSPVTNVQVGAYRNQDCAVTQAFQIGGGAPIVIDDHRPGTIVAKPEPDLAAAYLAMADCVDASTEAFVAAQRATEKVRAAIERARTALRIALVLVLAAPVLAHADVIQGGARQRFDAEYCTDYRPVWPELSRPYPELGHTLQLGPEAPVPGWLSLNNPTPEQMLGVQINSLYASLNAHYAGASPAMPPTIGYDQLYAATAVLDTAQPGQIGPLLPMPNPAAYWPFAGPGGAERERQYKVAVAVFSLSMSRFLTAAQLAQIHAALVPMPTCGGLGY